MSTDPNPRPRPGFLRSLAAKLALLSFATSVLAAGLVALATGKMLEHTLEENTKHELQVYARVAAERFDRIKAEELEALRGAAAHPRLVSPSATADSRREYLATLTEGGSYAWAGFADSAGIVTAATDRVLEAADLSQEFWFKEGLTDSYRGIALEQPVFAQALGTKSRFVAYGFPVRDAGGQLLGVLGVMQPWLFPRTAMPFDSEPTSPGISAYLRPPKKTWQVDSRGSPHYPVAPDTGGMPRGAGRDSLNGIDALYGFAFNADRTPWLLMFVVRLPAETVFAPVRELQQHMLQWGLAAGALLAIPAFAVGRHQERKLRAMAKSARLVAAGDPFSRMPEFRSRDQLADTAESLNRMIESLKAGRPDDSRGT
jgi:HAMP domain-containing protein